MSARFTTSRASRALLLAALLAVTAFAYQPAWHGGPLWDDDGHLTRVDLQSADGLRRIWFEVGATQQYYPLTHTAFWIMHRLWGDATTGYHAVNIALHALSAWLVVLILRKLTAPGAVLAGIVFALHPVHVESVAWITELKNTLSGVLYLSAALMYLRFDEDGRRRDYWAAAVLFALALLAKTVVATLPAGLLIAVWWRRGRIEWQRDVRPLAPWMAVGAAAGILTAWVERAFIGASGADFDLTMVERGLLASRALWFYLAKLAVPIDLVFIYPRWTIDQAAWWQYLFPAALVALAVVCWRVRARTRAPLAALLFFGVTLVPALGFVNVFPFRYSFVADHFQYLASLGVIAIACGAIARFADTLRFTTAGVRRATAMAAVATPLFALTWQQSQEYVSAEVLYRATLAKNPACWMALHNLALLEIRRPHANLTEAAGLIERSLALYPANAEAHNSLGLILQQVGRTDEALAHFQESVRLQPGYAVAHNSLGVAAYARRQLEAAIAHYRDALRLNPDYADARRNLGIALVDAGDGEQAIRELSEAVRLHPASAAAHDSLGTAYLKLDRLPEAERAYREALRHDPQSIEARNNLAIALEQQGRIEEALVEMRDAIRAQPASAKLQANIGRVLFNQGRHADAESHLRTAIRLDASYAPAHADLANLLLAVGRLPEAVEQYRRALDVEGNRQSAALHNDLGVALASQGRLKEAVVEFQEALRISPDFPDAKANLARAGIR